MRHDLSRWVAARSAQWQALDAAERALRPGRLRAADAELLLRGYRSLGGDLSLVRAELPQHALTQRLEALYRRLHARLHAPYTPWRERLVALYRDEVPQAARRLLPALRAVIALFLLAAAAGWALVDRFPELAALFASEQMIAGVQQGELWTDQVFGVVPPAMASAGIALNNIVVSLFAFMLGLFYGLGTLYIIGLNGLMLGGIFAFVQQHGLAARLAQFIVAHGVAELSIICLAGAAGLSLGSALARPGLLGRGASLRAAVADSGRLFAVLVPALLVCGWVEGHVSPDASYAGWPRVAIGLGIAVLLWAALYFRRGGTRAG